MPLNVNSVKIYTEVYCHELDARWKQSKMFHRHPIDEKDIDLLLKKQDFIMRDNMNKAFIGSRFDILSIEYNDHTPNYYKQICIKKQSKFIWNMDEQLIAKFRDYVPRQLLLSETFDEVNNNWGLWMIPMGLDSRLPMDERYVTVELLLYHMPVEIKTIKVRVSCRDNHSWNKRYEDIYYYNDGQSNYMLDPLFPSKDLMDIESLKLQLELEITFVEWNEGVEDLRKAIIVKS